MIAAEGEHAGHARRFVRQRARHGAERRQFRFARGGKGFAGLLVTRRTLFDGRLLLLRCGEMAGARHRPLHRDLRVLEQGQQRLRLLFGDRKRLRRKLLLGLQRGELGAFRCQIGIGQRADTGSQRG